MICPPLPWRPTSNLGAYFIEKPVFVRQFGDGGAIRKRLANSSTVQDLAETVTKIGTSGGTGVQSGRLSHNLFGGAS